MRSVRTLLFRLADFFFRERRERDLADEIEAHLQLHTEDNVRLGMNPEEARRAAVLKLGGIESVKEQYRDRRSLPWMESLRQDLRLSIRALCAAPGFTSIAVLTLAIGIGAVTSVFSVVDATLLKSLPYPQSNRIMTIARTSPQFDHPVPLSGADFLDYCARSRTFSQMAAYNAASFARTAKEGTVPVFGASVSPSFFSVLGIRPHIGRTFRQEEDRPGKNRVLILSDGLWQKWFGHQPRITGRSLVLNGENYTIIGVLPPHFHFEDLPEAQLWVPLVLRPDVNRGDHWLRAIGRLAPGASFKLAQAEMDMLAGQLQREHPQDDKDQGIIILPFQSWIAGINKDVVLTFFGAVLLVLLIACANVAGLILARSATRRKAFAMRAVLGATRWRIIRELISESILLSVAAGCAGIATAYTLTPLFRAQTFVYLPRAAEIAVDHRILLFALGVSILTGLVFGLTPALELSRVDLNDILKAGSSQTAMERRWSLRSILVVGEIALLPVLLISAGLLTRSLIRVLDTNPGYRTDHLLTFWLTLPQNRYLNNAAISQASEEILQEVARVPGVRSVALTTALPPYGWESDGGFLVLGHPGPDMQHAPDTFIDAVNANFFATLGLSLTRGRLFTEQDNRPDAAKVVVISRTLADRYFQGQDPLGQHMIFEGDDPKGIWTVVGVVADSRFFGWDHDTGVFTYFPYKAAGSSSHFAIAARTLGDPAALSAVVKKAVWSVDRDLPLLEMATMRQRMDRAFAPWRFDAAILAGFAALALLLVSIGIFGLLSYLVVQRTREIGVRMALGAKRQDILILMLKRSLILTLVGISVGLPCSLFAGFLLKSLLYGTKPFDVPVLIFAISVLLLMAIVAAFVPARAASSIDPMAALRVG